MTTNQLDLFDNQIHQNNQTQHPVTPVVLEPVKFKPSPIDLDILDYLIGRDLMSDTYWTNVDEANMYYFEGYEDQYRREHELYISTYEHEGYTEEEIDNIIEKLSSRFFETFVRIFMPMQELFDNNFRSLMTPLQYVNDLYDIYAREESLAHFTPIPYYQWMNSFKGWIHYKNEAIYTQYMFNY